MEFIAEELLGGTAHLLAARGDEQSAQLLRDVVDISIELKRQVWHRPGTDHYSLEFMEYSEVLDAVDIVLRVDAWLVPRFDEEVKQRLVAAFDEVLKGHQSTVENVIVVPRAGDDWRERLDGMLAVEGLSNQGRVRPSPGHPRQDTLAFSSEAELHLYEAGKRLQARLPPETNVTLIPRSGSRLPGRTFEPDLIVVYGGRVALVEVDGPHHRGKWADDKSRDRLFEDAGFAYITHIDAADTGDPAQLDMFFDRLLKKLA